LAIWPEIKEKRRADGWGAGDREAKLVAAVSEDVRSKVSRFLIVARKLLSDINFLSDSREDGPILASPKSGFGMFLNT
jgi:hypothetical protein